MKERAEGLEKVAATDHTQQLPPGTATRMAVGAEIAPADPAPIGTVWVRAEVHRGGGLAAAAPCGHEGGWWSCGGGQAGSGGVLTGVAVRLFDEAFKGFGRTVALWLWGCGVQCRRARGGVAGPRPLEHEAQPHQGDQHQLVEKEMRYHGKTSSYTCCNEGIVPGFQVVGICRRLEGHDPLASRGNVMSQPLPLWRHLGAIYQWCTDSA